jgi:MFS family permease
LDYKIVLVITQAVGYMLSKFYGIRFIAELKRVSRGKLILLLVGISWMAWLLFAIVPAPYNFWCLLLNGFPLGMLWGIVFSYIEGRRATDFISAALAISFIFGSGVAKSVALLLMNKWGVTEYWMPFTVGLIFFIPLLALVYALEKITPPSAGDELVRMKRLPMTSSERKQLLLKYGVGIVLLVAIYMLVTILREVRDNFMADMWRESGETFQASVFAQTETIISFIILLLVAIMVVVRNSFTAFSLALGILLTGFFAAGIVAILYSTNDVSFYTYITITGLGLYLVYIPYNSILFERFIAAFRISGNVGFLIYLADSFGYLGNIAVTVYNAGLSAKRQWLNFYNTLVLVMAIVGVVCTVIAILYFTAKRKHN